jgi:2-polyprenyl-6-methoxyphenol hydroxylase-like FAD-dependent oxidoreductase
MEKAFFEMTDSIAPSMGERMRAGKREERYCGSADLPNFVRASAGKGWALVGDAGYHKDPVTGQGMLDAFIDSEILADAIDSSLGKGEPLDAALARYERTRNERVLEMYRWTCLRAQGNPGQSRKILAWLKEDQERADRFFGIAAGSVRASDLFPQLTEELSRPLRG